MTSFLLAVESVDCDNDPYKWRNLGLSHVGPIIPLVQRPPARWRWNTWPANEPAYFIARPSISHDKPRFIDSPRLWNRLRIIFIITIFGSWHYTYNRDWSITLCVWRHVASNVICNARRWCNDPISPNSVHKALSRHDHATMFNWIATRIPIILRTQDGTW